MPAKAGTHASLREREGDEEQQVKVPPARLHAEAGVDPGLRRDDGVLALLVAYRITPAGVIL